MRVKISETVEVSDEQRLAIAQRLHGPAAKKDHATREELKDFVWRHGRDWPLLLQRADEYEEDGGTSERESPKDASPYGMELI
jgi:hypothetical protein